MSLKPTPERHEQPDAGLLDELDEGPLYRFELVNVERVLVPVAASHAAPTTPRK